MTDRGSSAGEVRLGSGTLAVVGGDITSIAADAIVNAANESLVGGGGVDGAIHRVGGPPIMAELEERYGPRRHCPTGSAVITGAGQLPARWVIHAVGPIWRGGKQGEPDLLASAYRASFGLAADAGARTLSLPAISCGVYGYPLREAAHVALETAASALDDPSTTVERATFVLFSPETLAVFGGILAEIAAARRG